MKFKYVDVLRGLAVLAILIVHSAQYGNNNFTPYLTEYGAMGVQLFYIASAFTLFLSMDRRYSEETFPIKNFFIRRFFRIAPMYYIGIAYYLWQDGFGGRYWLGDANSISLGNILSNVFFIHGFNPYWMNSIVPGGWSIAVEMSFYCLVPFLFSKIKNTQQAFVFLLFTLLFRVVLYLLLRKLHVISSEMLWSDFLYFYLPSQLPIFGLGILLYFIIKNNYKLSISPFLIIFTSVIIICQVAIKPILPEHFLFGIAFLILAIGLSKYDFRIFINPVFVHLGKISFSMYLVHFAVLHWLNRLNFVDYISATNRMTGVLNYSIRLIIVIIISTVVSTLCYKLVELPMQNLGKHMIVKLNNVQTPDNRL